MLRYLIRFSIVNVKHNIKNKILYYFNNSLDKGTLYIIIWLTLALTFIVAIASIILIISNTSQGLSFFENLILLAGKTLEYEQSDTNSFIYEFLIFIELIFEAINNVKIEKINNFFIENI